MKATAITERPADKMFGYKFGVDGLLSVSEAAELLSVHRMTIYRMLARNELRMAKTPTGRSRICRRSVTNYIAGMTEQ